MTYSFFPRNFSRGFHGSVTHSFFHRNVFRGVKGGESRGFTGVKHSFVSWLCDTFIFQRNISRVPWVCDTFDFQNEKKKFSRGLHGFVTHSFIKMKRKTSSRGFHGFVTNSFFQTNILSGEGRSFAGL